MSGAEDAVKWVNTNDHWHEMHEAIDLQNEAAEVDAASGPFPKLT